MIVRLGKDSTGLSPSETLASQFYMIDRYSDLLNCLTGKEFDHICFPLSIHIHLVNRTKQDLRTRQYVSLKHAYCGLWNWLNQGQHAAR